MKKKSFEDNELAVRIGKLVQKKRVQAGLTQDQVAGLLHTTIDNISRVERGLTLPNVAKLITLAEVFNCPVEELLSESSNREADQQVVLAGKFNKLSPQNRELLIRIADVMEEDNK